MNLYDDQTTTVGQLFERFFPGREDVIRLLMEPITYANGSTLEDPAMTYGIVFSNFMSKGVYTFEGGTDRLIELMHAELERRTASMLRIKCDVEKILAVTSGRVTGVEIAGRQILSRRSSPTPISRRRFSTSSATSTSIAALSTRPGPCG